MRLKLVLPVFALLLVVSTATSFIGYKYLGLASEYRERNFLHLSETQKFIGLLGAAPVMRLDDIALGRGHIEIMRGQAEWCLSVLTPFERWMFRKLGAGGALVLCERDIELNIKALDLLQRQEAPFVQTGAPAPDAFALNLETQAVAHGILQDSLDFHPYVSIIEDRLKVLVVIGTVATALGLLVALVIVSRDLLRTQRKQEEQTEALERQTQELSKLATIAERANDSIILADTQGCITWINPAFSRMTGFSFSEARGHRPGSLLQGEGTDSYTKQEIGEALQNNKPIKRDILNYTKDGQPYWVSLSISALETDDGEHFGYVAISSDISNEVKQREEIDAANREIEHQSLHDPLTQLPNRRALDDAIANRIATNASTTLVRIDLDHFKYVNDTFGHQAGDFVLEHVAEILRTETRRGDLPARVGGDEFVILLANGSTSEHGRTMAERILRRIKDPIGFKGKTVRVGGSFGVASSLDDLLGIEELVVGADAALYEAKESGRNRVHLYTPSLHHEIAERRRMARELKKAVAEEEFLPFYQPQVDALTRRLIGVEALARWESSALGFLPPNQFMPVAERLSIVEEIDDIIFRKAVAEISELHKLNLGIDKLSLNVTATRIYDPSVVESVQAAKCSDLKISFEVLESVLVEDQGELFQFGVDALRDAGISIEIDDFGSGHASIVGLMQLQPDAMKIDRRLIESIEQDRASREVVESIVNIAKSMKLTVVAEGVETFGQADILADMGCNVLQGYVFAKPMSGADLKEFASNRARSQVA